MMRRGRAAIVQDEPKIVSITSLTSPATSSPAQVPAVAPPAPTQLQAPNDLQQIEPEMSFK